MKPSNQARIMMLAIRKQAGMTLMEIIAALAIIAAVIVGALALFNSAQSSNQSVSMLKNVIAIRAAIQQLYLGQGGYTGNAAALNTQLFNSKKYPTDLVWAAGTTSFRTPWGGTLSVAQGTGAAPTPNFTITLTAVPPEVCSQLVTNASNGWSLTRVNNATVGSTAGNATPYPVTPARANAACGVNAAGVTVIFTTVN